MTANGQTSGEHCPYLSASVQHAALPITSSCKLKADGNDPAGNVQSYLRGSPRIPQLCVQTSGTTRERSYNKQGVSNKAATSRWVRTYLLFAEVIANIMSFDSLTLQGVS